MRTKFALIFFLVSCVSFAQTSSQSMTEEQMDSMFHPKAYASVGHPYLDFKFTGNKAILNNQSLKGKVVVLSFWFEGCHPCMAEMDALNELYKKMKGNKDFVFLSITWERESVIKKVQDKYNLSFPVYTASDGECFRLTFGGGYPSTFVLDKEGTVRYRHSGGTLDKDIARTFIMTTLLSEIQSLL